MRGSSLVSMGVLALLFSVDRVAAQNLFEIYPTRPNISTTDYTRLGVPATGGDILVEVAPTHFCNVGGSAFCACSALEIDVTLMDMDDSTPNSFRGVIQSPIGTYLAVTPWTPMTVGTGGPSVETFRVPFTASPVLPCTGIFYFGVEVDGSNCGDGIHVAAARYDSTLSGCAGRGETCRVGAPSLLWSGAPAAAVAWLGPKKMSLRMGITMDSPVLNLGNTPFLYAAACAAWKDGYGVGGLYPYSGTSPGPDLLIARAQEVASPNGQIAVFAGITPWVPLCLPPYGTLCLYPELFVGVIQLDGSGVGTAPLLTVNSTWPPVTFQGYSLNTLLLTNAEVMRP